MRTRLLVVQHAEKQPHPGDPGLSGLGSEQALALSPYFEQLKVAAVWSSPLRRALETARPIAERIGSTVVTDERLRERMNWSGEQSLQEFQAEWTLANHDRDFEPRCGQSSCSAGQRLEEALHDIGRSHAGLTVVAVCHGGVTVDMARNLVGDQVVERVAPHAIDIGLPPCSITEIVQEEGHLTLLTLGNTQWMNSS